MIITEVHLREAQLRSNNNTCNEAFLPRTGCWIQKWSIWCSSWLRGLWNDSPTCLSIIGGVSQRKARPASQALCAGGNRFSAPGMHFTLSASSVHTAPLQTRTGSIPRRSARRSHQHNRDINGHVSAGRKEKKRRMKIILSPQEAGTLLRLLANDWLAKDSRDGGNDQSC